MGYLHDINLSRFLHCEESARSGGAWTTVVAGNVWSLQRSAGAGTFFFHIPIFIPSNARANRIARVASLDVWYFIGTAVMSSLSASIYKVALPATGAAWSAGLGELQSFAYDADHDSAGERVSVDEHKMTLTLDTPVWINSEEAIYLQLSINPGATAVFSYYGSRVNYTLRI